MGVRMGVPEGKHADEAPDWARVAVMSCGLNRAGGGRPSFRATRASVRKISPLVRRAGYAHQKFPSESAFPFFFSPMPLKFRLPFRMAALSASTALR